LQVTPPATMRSDSDEDSPRSPLLSDTESSTGRDDNEPLLAYTGDGEGGGGGTGVGTHTGTGGAEGNPRGRAFWLAWAGFFALGTVNNLPYVIVSSSADAIVKRYCVENLIGGE
jgi:hypothetical protein